MSRHLVPVLATISVLSVSSWSTFSFVNAADYTYEEFNTGGVRNNNGPTKWADVKDATTGASKYSSCGVGSAGSPQSPIDLSPKLERTSATLSGTSILSTSHALLGPLVQGNGNTDGHLKLGSPQSTFTLNNDGAQMRVQFEAATADANLAATLPQFVDPMSKTGNAKYRLNEIFFKHVSDHAIADSRSDFEIQLLFHRVTTDVTSTGTSASGTSDASMVVVSILLDACLYCKNAELAKFWHLLPSWNTTSATVTTAATTTSINPVDGISLDVSALLPQSRDYACYVGSLTHPPCTRNVRHYVMDGISSGMSGNFGISFAQIEHFKRVMGWKNALASAQFNPQITLGPFGNYRPLQSDSTSRFTIYRYLEMGDSNAIDSTRTDNVFYDSSKDEDSSLAYQARIAAYVGIILGFFATLISIVAMVQTYQNSAGAGESANTDKNASASKRAATDSAAPKSEKYAAAADVKDADSDSGVSSTSAVSPANKETTATPQQRTRVRRFKTEDGASPATPKTKRRGK